MRFRTRYKAESGAATIEAIVAFTGFLFTIFTILNVVNFCRAQTLISNAVDASAKELSEYTYFYHLSGLENGDREMQGIAEKGRKNMDDVIGTVDNLFTSISAVGDTTAEHMTNIKNGVMQGDIQIDQAINAMESIRKSVVDVDTAYNSLNNAIGDVINNPVLYLKSIIAIAAEQGISAMKTAFVAVCARGMVASHFGKTKTDADAALNGLGLKNGLDDMNFLASSMFDNDTDDIHIVVYYKLQMVQLFGKETLEVTLRKEAVARAWLGGDAG